MAIKYVTPTKMYCSHPHFYMFLSSFFDLKSRGDAMYFLKTLTYPAVPFHALFPAQLSLLLLLFWRCPTTCVTLLKHFSETYPNTWMQILGTSKRANNTVKNGCLWGEINSDLSGCVGRVRDWSGSHKIDGWFREVFYQFDTAFFLFLSP